MTKDTAPFIITLDEVMANYDGKLSALLAGHAELPNILITWQVDVEIKNSGRQAFFVAVQSASPKYVPYEAFTASTSTKARCLSFCHATCPSIYCTL